MLITLFALIIAFVLVELALPAFNNFSGKHLSFDIKPMLAFYWFGIIGWTYCRHLSCILSFFL